MNEELAAYITYLCELSGHTTRIEKDLILIEPREGYTDVYDAFTMVEEYYAYGHVERYSFSGARFSSASFEIFKKFAIMHFAADIRAAHQLPPLTAPSVTDVHPSFSIEFLEPITYLLTSKASPMVNGDICAAEYRSTPLTNYTLPYHQYDFTGKELPPPRIIR